ncbi:hypothetical protein JW826_02745 [Candidatus Woesearchaeota archaeon]|nr:hypothetical protein [Candidatus Woesearchaeota archaeon]
MIKANADCLFEASWEVCNKCGGINTVIKTKAPHVKNYYKDYFLIGPYFEKNAEVELQQVEPPDFLKGIFHEMQSFGVTCYFGNWLIRGEPFTILLDFQGFFSKKDEVRTILWEKFGVDSLLARFDFDEPVLWSWASGMLLEKIASALPDKRIVAQFHEWLSGAGLLYLKANNVKIGTVFTTHATMLGRTLASVDFDLYGELGKFDPLEKAKQHGMAEKHTMEVASARNADIFTTVSEITGLEAEKVLGRKPDVLLLNGIDLDKFPTIEETSIKHVTFRGVLREFLTYHFFPYYTFDLSHNLMFFCASRYEFHNKGIDILIKALGLLNEQLKRENSDRTVTMFFWIPMGTRGVKVELLENKNYYKHITSLVNMKSEEILQQIVTDFISQKADLHGNFFDKDFMKELKRNILTFHRVGNPSILTHNIDNEGNDAIVQSLLAEGLDNKEDDKVKVIVYPVYLSGNDGLLNLSYYDAMAGCHLGIFPSYYEPWGYTPLEAAAMGLSSITSDLSGFGMYMKNRVLKENTGIYILSLLGRTRDQQVKDLAAKMYTFAMFDHAERVQNKINAKYLSNLADWKHFVKFYITAHNKAIEKRQSLDAS